MTLLKSLALQQEEELARLKAENADLCYAIIDGWQKKTFPIITSTVAEPPPGKVIEDCNPFGYNHGHLPSRGYRRHARWSEL